METKISSLIIMIMLILVVFLYLYHVFKLIRKKKIIKSVALILPILLLIIAYFYIITFNYTFKLVILSLVKIIGYVCLPLITLGIAILGRKEKRKLKIIVALIMLVYIYLFNGVWLLFLAKDVVEKVTTIPFYELIEAKEKEGLPTDITYLNNFTQKIARDGYLSQWDVKQIIEITDSKSTPIVINYKDKLQEIDLSISNKDDQKIEELKENLKSDYYKFNYSISENKEITINIERYVIEETIRKEKNEDIVLTGTKNDSIIKNINKYISEDHESFLFENELNVQINTTDKSLKSFKILLDYDEEKNNCIPVVDNIKEYDLIHSYKVYQSGVEIILNEDVKIENKDYTIRVNRYDKDLNISKNSSYYFYEYEPIVTQMTTYKNKVVLEMKFDRDYTINELKNIEIIFGK